MPDAVDRRRMQELVAAGATLVEVLSRGDYDDEHLPGARSIPLSDLTSDAVQGLDPAHPVVVYCWDGL